ncbi:histone deacetylase 11 isoform X1 [Ictalurus furcatus]|uniref:histone deacetylase 11 isoform X1 n=1 Tax=Ictalurus furcatus TaxID=66913 RepID=UPI0023507446|nr:histone deacetylase 11 isoform X1 [Ictalurus furcatus]
MSSKESSEGKKGSHQTELYEQVPASCLPIVYSPVYNITFMGLEKLHPFDAGKWGKVIHFLKEEQFITDETIVAAREASEEDLLVVHTKRYLSKLKWSLVVATITEIPPLVFLPNFLVQRKVLRPLRTQTGGTIMAGKLAMDRGWAINVGGGFHHCSSDKGGGFCAYADITLAIKFLFERVEGVSRATIIDLDAHQGNGHERDFLDDRRVYIMDVYNRHIYPGDGYAKRKMGKRKDLSVSDKGQIVMARRLSPSISKTAGLEGCSRYAMVSTYQKGSKEGQAVTGSQAPNRCACGVNLAFLVRSHRRAPEARIAEKVHAGCVRKVSEHTVHHSLLHMGLRSRYECVIRDSFDVLTSFFTKLRNKQQQYQQHNNSSNTITIYNYI